MLTVRFWLPLIALLICPPSYAVESLPQPSVSTLELAERVLDKGLGAFDLGTYPGILLLHGMSELALVSPDPALLERTIGVFQKFRTKEIEGRGSFICYRAGGNGAAYLHFREVAPLLGHQVTAEASLMMEKQRRSDEGLLVPPGERRSPEMSFFGVPSTLPNASTFGGKEDYFERTEIDVGAFEQVSSEAKRLIGTRKGPDDALLVPLYERRRGDMVFIDMAFAVTPYLLYVGLAEKRNDYIDMAVYETVELFRILRDQNSGLLHQGRGFRSMGVVSQDNWSRGNGWGALALAALVRDLPADHPKRAEVDALAKEYFAAVLRYQDKDGLWHQEMTDFSSYVETSGSGLLLYSLGVAFEKGLLEPKYRDNLVRGLSSLTAYIADDGSVSHTCAPCLCPGQGTKEDYKRYLWVYNDSHAFGPVVLAYAQAAKLGIKEVVPSLKPGCLAAPEDSPGQPKTYVQYVPERKGQDVAWENDRIAFRLFGPLVRNKVGSGIDIWAKSVDYPIVQKWYRLAAEGYDYHADRGEGCDFYDMGRLRGCGGLAVWREGKPYASLTYATQTIVKNTPGEIEFTLTFEPWDAAGRTVVEEKTIRMVPGTNFFQVTSVLKTSGAEDLVVGIGLTTYGRAIVGKNPAKGVLSCWEKISPAHGSLGLGVVVKPQQLVGYAQSENDQYVLIRVKPNQPFSYYAGAGWEGNERFQVPNSWENYVLKESSWPGLNEHYSRKSAGL